MTASGDSGDARAMCSMHLLRPTERTCDHDYHSRARPRFWSQDRQKSDNICMGLRHAPRPHHKAMDKNVVLTSVAFPSATFSNPDDCHLQRTRPLSLLSRTKTLRGQAHTTFSEVFSSLHYQGGKTAVPTTRAWAQAAAPT